MTSRKKNIREEMYLAIEIWKESGLRQSHFCKQEGMSRSRFGYWLKKYRKDHERSVLPSPSTFIPLKVSATKDEEPTPDMLGAIEITYPNGIHVSCPSGTAPIQLKALLSL